MSILAVADPENLFDGGTKKIFNNIIYIKTVIKY